MINKALHFESTSQMGWLLYSMSTLELSLLAKFLVDKCRGVSITFRFKYIDTDKYEPDHNKRKKWMPIHIEVDTNDRKRAARRLFQVYISSLTDFQLGIRIRIVYEFREVNGNPITMEKHMRLRVRQASFNNLTVGRSNDGTMLLDYDSKVDGVTLRSMIIEIQSANSKTCGNLFHVIEKDWKGVTYQWYTPCTVIHSTNN